MNRSDTLYRVNEYSTFANLRIWVGTFNLNGKSGGARQDLSTWLCPQIEKVRPDIIAVGFQEIVELSPQQIMSTDPVRRQVWEEAVGRTLNDNAKKTLTRSIHSFAKWTARWCCAYAFCKIQYFIKNQKCGGERQEDWNVWHGGQ